MESAPDTRKRALVDQWLSKADEDFRLASHLVSEGACFPSAIAFHSQQAAEKYLKALLADRDRPFPKTHDLARLLELVEEVVPVTAEALAELDVLNPYGVETRYPGDSPCVTGDEARRACGLARGARDAILAALDA